MQRRWGPRVEAHGAARQNAGLAVDVDGGLGDTSQEELLVDDVLSMPRNSIRQLLLPCFLEHCRG